MRAILACPIVKEVPCHWMAVRRVALGLSDYRDPLLAPIVTTWLAINNPQVKKQGVWTSDFSHLVIRPVILCEAIEIFKNHPKIKMARETIATYEEGLRDRCGVYLEMYSLTLENNG